MSKNVHIVCHEVPWPANYGGLIDIFYKIVWLHKIGYEVQLHCFTEDNYKAQELEQYCTAVHYYKRETGLKGISLSLPYIVQSRSSQKLKSALLLDNHPILFEGIHCTKLLHENAFPDRKIFVRMFNVENKYYQSLAKAETNWLQKIYFKVESNLLKKYEKSIAAKATFLALSQDDQRFYKDELGAEEVKFLPVFLANDNVQSLAGLGDYCLYHGNLSISENVAAVTWLISEVWPQLQIPLIIAGKNPPPHLQKLIDENRLVSLVSNPSDEELPSLITNAQLNILPSFNNTGVKLKIINALFLGRHCLANCAAVAGSAVEDLCILAESAEEMQNEIKKNMAIPFTVAAVDARKAVLEEIYNNQKNADLLSGWLH